MEGVINITAAQYYRPENSEEDATTIKATIDGQKLFVPIAEGNRHYDEIKRQVDAGTLKIEEAD
tara:strand:- start:23 stop:214 length:192 start_codon:yes stop_codon:yes gene_type:complete